MSQLCDMLEPSNYVEVGLSRPYFLLLLIKVSYAVWRGAPLEMNGGTKTDLTYKRPRSLKCDRRGSCWPLE
jgi:hypothetical protein